MTDLHAITVQTASGKETRKLGRHLATCLLPGDILLLHGDLGAGKTTLAQGILEALVPSARVASPTFTMHVTYPCDRDDGQLALVHHLDLFRLTSEDELATIGYGDILDDDQAVTLVEWPERAGSWRPDRYILVQFRFGGDDRRALVISLWPQRQRRFDAIRSALESGGWRSHDTPVRGIPGAPR